jgi:hypothetical protein
MYQYNKTRPTTHFFYDVAKGNMFDTSPVNVFGYNQTIGTTFETVWDDGGSYVYPTSALIMDVVSTSASDTMNLFIDGLDINYNQITETVTLTGTSAVTTTTAFYRINRATILSGSNVGNISISNGGTNYAFIGAEIGSTQACIYTVPAGHSAYFVRFDIVTATANQNKYVTFRNVLTTNTGRILRVGEGTIATNQVSLDRQVPFKIAEKTDFHFEAKSSQSENEVAIIVEGILTKD